MVIKFEVTLIMIWIMTYLLSIISYKKMIKLQWTFMRFETERVNIKHFPLLIIQLSTVTLINGFYFCNGIGIELR